MAIVIRCDSSRDSSSSDEVATLRVLGTKKKRAYTSMSLYNIQCAIRCRGTCTHRGTLRNDMLRRRVYRGDLTPQSSVKRSNTAKIYKAP